jgi:hypothetical protein
MWFQIHPVCHCYVGTLQAAFRVVRTCKGSLCPYSWKAYPITSHDSPVIVVGRRWQFFHFKVSWNVWKGKSCKWCATDQNFLRLYLMWEGKYNLHLCFAIEFNKLEYFLQWKCPWGLFCLGLLVARALITLLPVTKMPLKLPHVMPCLSSQLFSDYLCWNIEKHWNKANMATSDKRPEKNNVYGWLPSSNGLPDNVQHLPLFPLCSHYFL